MTLNNWLPPWKETKVLNDGQGDFLADLLHVLAREIVPELKDKAPCRCVMEVEQLVPGPRFTTAAAGKQVSFSVGTHADSDSIGGRSV